MVSTSEVNQFVTCDDEISLKLPCSVASMLHSAEGERHYVPNVSLNFIIYSGCADVNQCRIFATFLWPFGSLTSPVNPHWTSLFMNCI